MRVSSLIVRSNLYSAQISDRARVAEDLDVGACESSELLGVGAVGAGEGEIVKEPGGPAVQDLVAAAQGVLAEGAAEEGLGVRH